MASPSNTSLHDAASKGQLELALTLLDAGADIHATIGLRQSSALMLAAAEGFDDMTAFLLSRGAGVDKWLDAQDFDGETALHQAVKHGHASTCDVLLGAGADIHVKDWRGWSPIHTASSGEHLDVLRKLLERYKDVLFKEDQPNGPKQEQAYYRNKYHFSDKRTLLELAVSHDQRDIMLELLKYPHYNSDRNRAVALLIAAKSGSSRVVEELLNTRITTIMNDTRGNNALHLATLQEHPDIVESLLRSGYGSAGTCLVDTQNESSLTPLHLAVRSGVLETVQILLRYGADVNTVNEKHETPFHYALSYHNVLTVKSKTPQTESVYQDRLDLVKLLLDHGCNINAPDVNGLTALHVAVAGKACDQRCGDRCGQIALVELLISRDADCAACSNDGSTPLHTAAYRNERYPVQLLLENGADINAKTRLGRTPLWIASSGKRDAVVDQLLKWPSKPELDTQDCRSKTPHVCDGSAAITALLLNAGAKPGLRDYEDNPPFFKAAVLGGPGTMQMYLNAGIDINTLNDFGEGLVEIVAHKSTLDRFIWLEENGADMSMGKKNGETVLHYAAINVTSPGHKILEHLLLLGKSDVVLEADCERFGTPLMAAATRSTAANTVLLLQHGAKVNTISDLCPTHTALQTAAAHSSHRMVRALIDAGADANIRGGSYGSALCAAVAAGSPSGVARLIDEDKDISYVGPMGSALEIALSGDFIAEFFFETQVNVNTVSKTSYGTPLIKAIAMGKIREIKKLLELGADVNLFPDKGEPPLQWALRKCPALPYIVELLIKNGAELDHLDKGGRGVLSQAIFHRGFASVPYLLQQPGIDVDHQDGFGRTPLIHAIIQGEVSIVDDILARKPMVDVQDRWGKTALIYAMTGSDESLMSKLISAHADPPLQDIRSRDALYWAALRAGDIALEHVFERMKTLNATTSRFQLAVIAATATTGTSREAFVRKLLDYIGQRDTVDIHIDTQTDEDGWTASYSALRYDRNDVASLIEETIRNTGREIQVPSTQPKPPTQWHPTDLSGYLTRHPDNISITVECDAAFPGVETWALARADHPIIPNENWVFYFEVTVINRGQNKPAYKIGFCDEGVDLQNLPGPPDELQGYTVTRDNSDGGGVSPHPDRPGRGDCSVSGCGVDFRNQIAFYTLDGKIMYCQSTKVLGKLYPAISIGTSMVGCTLTARFWSEDESSNTLFKFQGPYGGPETLKLSQQSQEEFRDKMDVDADSDVSMISA